MSRSPTAPLVPSVVSPRARRLPHAAALVTALLGAGAAAVVASSLLAPRAIGHEHHRRAHVPAPVQSAPAAPPTTVTLERRIDRAELDLLLSAGHPGARIVPALRHGQPVGFKVYAIQPGSLAAVIGLENGDTLHRLNGHDLSSPELAMGAYQPLRTADRFVLELTRAGEPLVLRVAVD